MPYDITSKPRNFRVNTNDPVFLGDKFAESIRVVAVIVERNGQVLVCQRSAEKRHGGLWEFPGGKLESGETHSDAARRELFEELGVSLLEFRGVICSLADKPSPFVIDFARATILGEPMALEHSEVRWVYPHELAAMRLAPMDRMVAVKLMQNTLSANSEI